LRATSFRAAGLPIPAVGFLASARARRDCLEKTPNGLELEAPDRKRPGIWISVPGFEKATSLLR
jgi:hypothetical protein